MKFLLAAEKASPLPDFERALTIIQELFTEGSFSEGLMLAGDTIQENWSMNSIEARITFLNEAEKLLPTDRDESIAFNNLREMARSGFVGSPEERAAACKAMATAVVLGLIFAMAKKDPQ